MYMYPGVGAYQYAVEHLIVDPIYEIRIQYSRPLNEGHRLRSHARTAFPSVLVLPKEDNLGLQRTKQLNLLSP